MTFTDAATQHLDGQLKTVAYRLELRTGFAQSSAWLEFPLTEFTLTQDTRAPATLRAELPNPDLAFSNESSKTERTQLLAEARLSCSIGAESEVLFRGRIFRVEPRDYGFVIHAEDWLALVNDCECEVDLAPDETAELAPARELALVGGGVFGSVFGFSYTGAGDLAFNQDVDPGTRRRSWAPGFIRLWYDSAATREVPPRHYQLNLTSGTVSVLEETAGRSYFATGVRCYIEGSLDWAEVFRASLVYPVGSGGIGAQPQELDLPGTGLGVAGPVYFQGKVADLHRAILARQQDNLRLWYNSENGCFTLRVITQQPSGNENWSLQHARSIAQPRDTRELYSRVVVTGSTERPLNALADSAVTITDITAGTTSWFTWDGLNVGADDTFANVIEALHDGDANKGASVHNLAPSEGGGSDQYDSWYGYVKIDLGQEQRLSRVSLCLPGSRNLNAAAGHQGMFWPGVKLLGSRDDNDYRLISANLAGRYAPQEQLEVKGKEILTPRVRYLKVLLGAYKHGFENQSDPSIGLAELAVYLNEEYRVIKEIDGTNPAASPYEYTADYDGDGAVDTWARYHPDLWTRLGGRHRTRFDNQAGELNEYLAHDRAIDLLAEGVRLFQQVTYTAVCDPRIRLYDTVEVNDELNGNVGSILVERVVLRRAGTEISGTNYLAEPLGNPA